MMPSALGCLTCGLTVLILWGGVFTGNAQVPKNQPTDVRIEGHIYEPQRLKPNADFVQNLTGPDGFKIAVFDEKLSNTRMLAMTNNPKHLYVTRREQGDCLLLRDENGDGKADGEPEVVARKKGLHGITFHDGNVYLAAVTEVYSAPVQEDGSFGELQTIINGLPDGGQHPNRTLAVGSNGKLYITVGSTCNACQETNPESATILRANLDGSQREIFASGLRNTIGFGWHPISDEMWGMDHGIDWLGNEKPREELNKLEQGKFYGWPYLVGENLRNPQDNPPEGTTFEDLEASATLPVKTYRAHSAHRFRWHFTKQALSRNNTTAMPSWQCVEAGTPSLHAATR